MTKGVEGLLADLRDNIAAVPIADIDLEYLAVNILYSRGSLPRDLRREATVAIRTLRSILNAARDPDLASPPNRGGDYTRCTSAEAESVDALKTRQQGEGS